MLDTVKPSNECLNNINRLKDFAEKQNKRIDDATRLVLLSQNEVKVALERQKAAEDTLTQAIENFPDGAAEGGREEDFAHVLKN